MGIVEDIRKHQDPLRYPKLQQPIEEWTEKKGVAEIRKISIDIAKILVK